MKKADKNVASPTTKVDWDQIKKEYFQGASLRSIARKYGIAVSTVSEHASKRGWQRTAERVREKAEQKIIEQTTDVLAEFNKEYLKAVLTMGQKVSKGIEAVSVSDDKAMRNYMAILKDLKDIGAFRSRLDIEEQEARIAKLKKECEEVEQDNTITVVLDESVKDYI